MKNEILILNAQIELQALITEREAMKSSNFERDKQQRSRIFNEDDFYILAEKIRKLRVEI